MKQSTRDDVTGDLTLEYFAKRLAEGWKIASINWFRESEVADKETESPNLLNDRTSLPYGFKISDGLLQENPLEASVLLLILDQIVKEKRIQEIAAELNVHGYSTREGLPWSATDVFNLMPRLIEAGPSLLKSIAWQQRRQGSKQRPEKTN